MEPAVGTPELIVEFFMEALIIYATFIFWRRYRRTGNRTLLVLTVIFALTMGLTVGFITSTLGRKETPYDDVEEFNIPNEKAEIINY